MANELAVFLARRQAAIQTEREQRAEWDLEAEFEHELKSLQYEFEAQMNRERERRRKYWEAMIEKRAAASRRDP